MKQYFHCLLALASTALQPVMAGEAMVANTPDEPESTSVVTTTAAVPDIRGTVHDVDGEPLEFVNVVLLNATDSTFVDGCITDADGAFSLPSKRGHSYVLKVSSVGYTTLYKDMHAGETAVLTLRDDAVALSEAVVTAQRALIQTEVDRTTYDVSHDEQAKTSSISEMLRKVPFVSVDGEGNVTVKGSKNFLIYKNGRPNKAFTQNAKDILAAIPAGMVEKIEVITKPGAQYDAEGVDGILNIVMKKNVAVGGVMGQLTAQAMTDQQVLNGFITSQQGKLTLSANVTGAYINQNGPSSQMQKTDLTYVDGTQMSFHTDQKVGGWAWPLGIEGSYEADSLNLITLAFDGMGFDVDIFGDAEHRTLNRDGVLLYGAHDNYDNSRQSYLNFSGHFDWQHLTHRPGEVMTLSYLLSTSDTHYQIGENYTGWEGIAIPSYSSYFRDNDGMFIEHTFQFDWERPLSAKHKLDMGAKYILRDNSSVAEQCYDEVRASYSDFTHLTNVGAAYGEWRYASGAFSARAGLRFEYAWLSAKFHDGSADDFSNRIPDLVPFAGMAYQINPAHSLKFNYSSRVERPGITYLNPAREETVGQVTYGNPYLVSSRPNVASLSHNYVSPKLMTGLTLSATWGDGGIAPIITVQDGILSQTHGNILQKRIYSADAFARIQPWPTTTLMINGSVFHNSLCNPSTQMSNDKWGWSGNFNLTQMLPWNLVFIASGNRIDTNLNDLYTRILPMYYYSFTLQRSFLKEKRLTVGLIGRNIFSNKCRTIAIDYLQGDATGNVRMLQPQRFVGINLSYRFGSIGTQVKKTSKTIENDDLIGQEKK